MKWSFATIGVIMLGVIGVSVIFLFQSVTTSNENDYYLLKEVTEAAMIDAIDIPYYRDTGELKIVREKFVENFTRRYAESTVFLSNSYRVQFYDIMEIPPKVSIIIDTGLGQFTVGGNTDEYAIKNKLDAILEYTGKNTYVTSSSIYYNNPYTSRTITEEYYAMPLGISGGSFNVQYSLKVPGKLVAPNIKNIKINSVNKISETINQGNLGEALLQNEIHYNDVTNVSANYLLSIEDFDTYANSVKFNFYNCKNSGNGSYKCDDTNKYYVTISGNASKNKAILKYEVIWSYDEYEFA